MSHVGGNDTEVNEQRSDISTRAGADDFGREVSKIAAAQICESAGFQSFKESAMDALAEIVVRYLYDLGKMANYYANIAGRTHCNVFDIIRALEGLEAPQQNQDASELSHCLSGSGTAIEIFDYVNIAEGIPFSQSLPRFPVIKNWKLIPSFTQMGETPPKHIPPWLPAFPDSHTYIHTPMWNERAKDPRADKLEQARQRRKAERSLLSLQQRLLLNGSVRTSAAVMTGETEREFKELPGFETTLAHIPLVQPSEDSISPVPLPATITDDAVEKENFSVLEAFAPAIEAIKAREFADEGEDELKVLPDVRRPVQFMFKTRKKYPGESLDLSLQKKGIGRTVFWIGREEERDDKKRRAEYIIRQSMENPQELTQL